MSRQGKIPVASALALTVAAGLALAQQHRWTPAAGRPAAGPQGMAAVVQTKGKTVQAGTTAQPNDDTGGQGKSSAKPSSVGSRALTGNDEDRQTRNQPEMATGIDLKGPPVRFPAADTPE
jgi:hypothetical protein